MADYSTSTPLTTDTGLVYGLVGVNNTNDPILFDPSSVGAGTVTFTAPTGFSVVGSPLTGTGTISLGFSAGYALPTTAKQTEWDTAYSWGDHATAGYLASGDIGSTVFAYDANLQAFTTAFTLPAVDGTAGQVLTTDGAGNLVFGSAGGGGTVTSVGLTAPTGFSVAGSPITSTGTLALSFDAGYSLPTDASQTNWNTAYGWGDHSLAGYLTSLGSVGGHTDVDTTSTPPTDKQVLQYQSGSGLWVPADSFSNGQIINGTAFFVTNTKPTTRIGGGALVTGDKWYKTDDGTEWFWNGTYWLSATERIIAVVAPNNISATTSLGIVESKSPAITSESMSANQINIFTTRCIFHSRQIATNDESNYWTCSLGAQNGFGTSPNISPAIPTVDTIGATAQGNHGRRKDTAINQLQTSIPYNVTATITKVGNPSNLTAHFIFLYRTVYI